MQKLTKYLVLAVLVIVSVYFMMGFSRISSTKNKIYNLELKLAKTIIAAGVAGTTEMAIKNPKLYKRTCKYLLEFNAKTPEDIKIQIKALKVLKEGGENALHYLNEKNINI
jgi:hypothetical protein